MSPPGEPADPVETALEDCERSTVPTPRAAGGTETAADGAVGADGFALISMPENMPPDGTLSPAREEAELDEELGEAIIDPVGVEIFDADDTPTGPALRTGGAYGGGGGAASAPLLKSFEKKPEP
jgi:hypothetical protein